MAAGNVQREHADGELLAELRRVWWKSAGVGECGVRAGRSEGVYSCGSEGISVCIELTHWGNLFIPTLSATYPLCCFPGEGDLRFQAHSLLRP